MPFVGHIKVNIGPIFTYLLWILHLIILLPLADLDPKSKPPYVSFAGKRLGFGARKFLEHVSFDCHSHFFICSWLDLAYCDTYALDRLGR